MKKLKQSENIVKSKKSNVNNIVLSSIKEIIDPIEKHDHVNDESFISCNVTSISTVSTASQTSTPSHQPIDENANVTLDISQRASDLVDELMRIVDEELEVGEPKKNDALATVLLDKTGDTCADNSRGSLPGANCTTSMPCSSGEVAASTNDIYNNNNGAGICSVPSVASVSPLVPDVDEAWLQKLDSIACSDEDNSISVDANCTKDVVNTVPGLTTLQLPRANMTVQVTNPLRKVSMINKVMSLPKQKDLQRELFSPNEEIELNTSSEHIITSLLSNQPHPAAEQDVTVPDSVGTNSAILKHVPSAPVKSEHCRRGRHKIGCEVDHLGPSLPSAELKSSSANDINISQPVYELLHSNEVKLSTTKINSKDSIDSAKSSPLEINSFCEGTTMLSGKQGKAPVKKGQKFPGSSIVEKSLLSKRANLNKTKNEKTFSKLARYSENVKLLGPEEDGEKASVKNPSSSMKNNKNNYKSLKSHKITARSSARCKTSLGIAKSIHDEQPTLNGSPEVSFNTAKSEPNYAIREDHAYRSNMKLKNVLEPVPVPSSYPSLGPGPPAVPCTGRKYVGAHISAAGGIHNVFSNAETINAKSFAMFMRSQRQWVAKPFLDKHVSLYKELGKDFPSHLILPHGSYLMNVGSSKPDLLEKSRALLVEELERCLQLGIPHFNFHPGSCVGGTSREVCCRTIAESINQAHDKVPRVIVVLENMCRQGNTIGGDFHELRLIIEHVKDRSRVGVCIDTCHAHNAGYDLATKDGFDLLIRDFGTIIGFQFLRGLHINDSKNEAGAHVDRHECIGKGHIGTAGMRRVMNCELFNDLPLILETPYTDDAGYAKEIRILENMISEKEDDSCKADQVKVEEEPVVETIGKNKMKAKLKPSESEQDDPTTEERDSVDMCTAEVKKQDIRKRKGIKSIKRDVIGRKRKKDSDVSEPEKESHEVSEMKPKRKKRSLGTANQ